MNRATRAPADEASWLRLDRAAGETLRHALERALRDAIREGALRPGVRLPSSRRLATQLGVSRGVVTDTYMQLEAQGYLIVRPGSAPLVAEVPAAPDAASDPQPPPARAAAIDLNATSPDIALFPAQQWSSALAHAVRTATVRTLDYGDARGQLELRATLADHLGRTRGVVADPDRILVVQGFRQAMDVLLRVLRERGALRVAVEDPSMTLMRMHMRTLGFEIVACPVDAHGLDLPEADVDAVVTTPAHQFPTGVVLSGERRRGLLTWAANRDAVVVEDDYDAEFRYDREPVRAMQGLAPEHVAYIGTVSKSLAPGLRIGWLVVPDGMAEDAVRAKRLTDAGSPALEQVALNRLIARGDYDRHVRRVRAIYRRRRDRLTESLERHLPELAVAGVTAGLHVTVHLPPGVDDAAVAAAALQAGVDLEPLSRYAVRRTDATGVILGYGRIHESAIDGAVAVVARAIASVRADA